MTDISREDALAHFGVKGQKWGVRKAVSGAASGAASAVKPKNMAARSTLKRMRQHEQALSGKGITGKLALADKAVMGKRRFEGYHNKKLSQLERSAERIEKGELIAKTILFGPQYTKAKKS